MRLLKLKVGSVNLAKKKLKVPKPEVEAFLTEYEALCIKYGLHINSCSCCNSPWVSPIDNARPLDVGHLRDVDNLFDDLKEG